MHCKELRNLAETIARAGIAAVDPAMLVRRSIALDGNTLRVGPELVDLARFKQIVVVGVGKASALMAGAVEGLLGDRISRGIIIVKDGHGRALKKMEVVETGHPMPDERGVQAARRLLSLVGQNARTDTLILCLISGGGSALMPLPHSGTTLSAKQEVTRLLLECGASIEEINAVRKHISQIKGGHLARAAAPARVVTLLLSDVIGDSLDVIASGPTVGDSTTFLDAKEVMDKYGVWERAPQSIREVIDQGLEGNIPETPKPDDEVFQMVSNVIIGNNQAAVEAASAKASALGFNTSTLSSCISGEAREAGKMLASIACEARISGKPVAPPACILAGGETTVTIRGNGKGGRNQELALAAALELTESRDVVVASVGTDGTDGPTDAAGAIVDTTTVARARARGLEPVEYLNRNDSYHLLEPIGDLFFTGPTGTNVMDLMIVLVG